MIKQPSKILIIAVVTITMLAAGMLSSAKLAKAQQTTSGIVTIAFDDGWNSQFNNSFPLMQEHGFTGTYYVIEGAIGTGDYMNMSDLHTLQNAGNEIASKSVDFPYFTKLTAVQINYECNASKQLLQANGFSAVNFAYPYGASNSSIDSIVLQYYRSARYSYGPGTGYLMPIPPSALQMSIPIGFAGETGNSSALAQDEAVVAQARATNSWVIIFFHNILTTPLTTPFEIEQSNFAAFLNYVGNSSVQVLTVNQALNLWSPSTPVNSPAPNAVSVTVNSALAAPTVTPAPGTVDQGQSSSLTSSSVTTGTSPYTYQWFERAPSGSYVTAGSNFSSFSFLTSGTTAPGSWSFILQVTDKVGAAVNSSAVSVIVNPIISASAGAGGTISPTGGVSVKYDENQTFTINANNGYYTVDVTVNGKSVGNVSSYTFNNVQAAYTISAKFAPATTTSPSTTARVPIPTPYATMTSPNQTKAQSLPQGLIYGIMATAAIVIIAAIKLASRAGTRKF